MTSADRAEKEFPGVMWQGRASDITDMQHLLDKFVIHMIAEQEKSRQLAIVLADPSGNPMLPPLYLNLGDTLVLREDDPWVPEEEKSDSIGIIRADPDQVAS